MKYLKRIVVGLLGIVLFVSTNTVITNHQAEAIVSKPCEADLIVIGARGSGQLQTEGPSNYRGFGAQAADVAHHLVVQAQNAGLNVYLEGLQYDARGTEDWLTNLTNAYQQSRGSGVHELRRLINNYTQFCEPDPQIVLIGFSQGGDVVKTFLDEETKNQINWSSVVSGVALIGEPHFNPDDLIHKLGSYDDDNGRLGTQSMAIPYRDMTVSLCNDKDWVCSPGPLEENSSYAHTDSYKGALSQRAGEFLANLVKERHSPTLPDTPNIPTTTRSFSNLPFECGVTVPYASTYDSLRINNRLFSHGYAIDFSMPAGTSVTSTIGGTAYVNSDPMGLGNYVDVIGDDGKTHRFGHLQSSGLVANHSKVIAGSRLGRVGTSGASTGAHLHYEQRQGTAQVPTSLIGNVITWGPKIDNHGIRHSVHSLKSANCGQQLSNLTLVKSPSSRTVFLLRDGKKWPIGAGSIVECLGGWGKLQSIPTATLDAIPQSAHNASCNGEMVRVNGTVWLLNGDQKQWVPTSRVVECLGGWDKVQIVTQKVLDRYPSQQYQAGCEGIMIRAEKGTSIVHIVGGQAFWVPNEHTVNCLGGWDSIHIVSREVFNRFPQQVRAANCEGQLIREHGQSAVYTIWNGRKIHVPNSATVECLGGWEEVHIVAAATRRAFRSERRTATCEGQLVRADGSNSVYWLEGGRAYPVPNAQTVECLGGWEEVHAVPPVVFNRYPRTGSNASCDGHMIVVDGTKDVYLIRDNKLHLIRRSSVVRCHGGWELVNTVPQLVANQFISVNKRATCST